MTERDGMSGSKAESNNENVVLRVIGCSSSVLLFDSTLSWQGVCAEGPGNAASLCTLASSLGTLAHNMGEAPQTIVAKAEDSAPAPAANAPEGEAAAESEKPAAPAAATEGEGEAAAAAPAPAATSATAATATATTATAAPATAGGKRVICVYFDNDAKVSGPAQRAKTRRVRRAARDEADAMPCVRLAIAQGQQATLCVFHLAKPTPAMRASGAAWARSASTLANTIDDMLCDAVVAFEKKYADDLTKLAPRIDVCSKSDGAEVLSDDERKCFEKCMEEVFAVACKEHKISLFLPA